MASAPDVDRAGGDSDEPPTEASDFSPGIPVVTAPVPGTGVWVGPAEEPARYERLKYVGGGAEGAVYRARFAGQSKSSTKVVALKEYHRPPGAPDNWPDEGTWLHLQDQVGVLQGLRQPHLVEVLTTFLGAASSAATDAEVRGRGQTFRTPYLVMEWVEGCDPAQLLRDGQVALAERLSWIRDLASVVDLLHSVSRTYGNPLVHGDIKPANCVITPDRGLVLVDTGAMTRLDASATPRGLCSPPYAAPEVLAAPGRARATGVDLFSLGAVAYLLLVGASPPSAESPTYADEASRLLAHHRWDGVPADRAARARELLLTYLSPDPEVRRRWAPLTWARELASVLDPPPRRPSPRVMRLVGIALASAVALGSTGVAIVADVGRRQPERSSSPNGPAAPAPQAGPQPILQPIARDLEGAFTVFGRRWADFPAVADDHSLKITPPTGPNAYDHLWGFYLPADACTPSVSFDLNLVPGAGSKNYGIGVALRATLQGDQPRGYSVQYEWEGDDITPQPGSYVRPAGLPGGAWALDVDPVPAPDVRTPRHVEVRAVGTALTLSIDGSEAATYELPEVTCGGVAIRVWGTAAELTNVRVTDG